MDKYSNLNDLSGSSSPKKKFSTLPEFLNDDDLILKDISMYKFNELFNLDKPSYIRKIGARFFSNTYIIKYNRTNLKILKKEFKMDNPLRTRNLKHAKIICDLLILNSKFFPYLLGHKNNCIYMEYFKSTSLRNYRITNFEDSKIIFEQIQVGLKYLHSRELVHNDLHLENILINKQNEVKIIDLDFVCKHGKRINFSNKILTYKDSKSPISRYINDIRGLLIMIYDFFGFDIRYDKTFGELQDILDFKSSWDQKIGTKEIYYFFIKLVNYLCIKRNNNDDNNNNIYMLKETTSYEYEYFESLELEEEEEHKEKITSDLLANPDYDVIPLNIGMKDIGYEDFQKEEIESNLSITTKRRYQDYGSRPKKDRFDIRDQ